MRESSHKEPESHGIIYYAFLVALVELMIQLMVTSNTLVSVRIICGVFSRW